MCGADSPPKQHQDMSMAFVALGALGVLRGEGSPRPIQPKMIKKNGQLMLPIKVFQIKCFLLFSFEKERR